MTERIQNVLIVGGGTAGWLSASLLKRVLKDLVNITLIESDDIGTVGVGEASIPPMVNFNAALGLDERTFIEQTQATYKLGIEFEGWGHQDSRYMHAFGEQGKSFPFCDFFQVWLKAKQQGLTDSLAEYSLNTQAAKANRFAHLQHIPNTQLQGLTYAYHFDAGLYAKLLSKQSQSQGVRRVEGRITEVKTDPNTGNIAAVILANGERYSADLYLDCSGLKSLLIDQTMNVGFEDWSHWLPCDSAWALPSEQLDGEIKPYTRAIAKQAGWQWQIPLQHRVGNGYVFSSKFISEQDAKEALLQSLPSRPLAEPKLIKFKMGMRRKQWQGNVFAVGLSSGFLEPLESTSIHLIQTSILRLIRHFPFDAIKDSAIENANMEFANEMEQVRDFIILHYKLTERDDSRFWQWCKNMSIPPSLHRKMALFEETGHFAAKTDDLFQNVAWQQVMVGQGLVPKTYHPLAEQFDGEHLKSLLDSLKVLLQTTVNKLPSHQAFIDKMTK
ncbi:tryptophan 7-halogenase [Pseudoalteromonas luteoviolacea]|uniref:tryptophan halogenase family protein n=1 Tax=Pseudoalteromonas luteoviolacea TaxID=43657 RepID=UPI001B39F3E9|nr:tryptophan halogenase family protein [Pseudoalteromonas luteoviolacea]MBQ4877825.1 tryptophan 7-halogenase [Pseudoalteromonas luteoviolacea]MBQ4906729.1 tryptophan 7-halogenase [Pseudoalteromonas luteoviolacea]